MSSYTVLTVFEGDGTINEPVISLPMAGKVSFRQIGFLMGLSVILPMVIYSGASSHILQAMPDPILSIDAVNAGVDVTWDVVLALLPVPAGLILGLGRPKLVPMDVLVAMIIRFMIYHTSLKSTRPARRGPAGGRKGKTAGGKKESRLAGFADPYEAGPLPHREGTHIVSVTELGVPKSITVTLYDIHGVPIRNRLARAYVDDMLQASVTTDSDGTMGMTFVPRSEGQKRLRIEVDGQNRPAVDAVLDVRRSK